MGIRIICGVLLGALRDGGLLKLSNDDPAAYLPARDLAEVSVADVLAAVRSSGEAGFLNPGALPLPEPVEHLVARIEGAIVAATAGISIRSLVIHTADPHGPKNGDAGAGRP